MLSKLLAYLGNPTDVRSLAAIILGILVTVVGHQSSLVTAVVDGVSGLVVSVDTLGHHVAKRGSVVNTAATDTSHVVKAISDAIAKVAADTAPKV